MTALKQLVNFFTIREEEKEILNNEIRIENIRRVLYLTLIAVPVSILHVLFFYYHLKDSNSVEYSWRLGIIYSHLAIIISLSLISFLIYWVSHHQKKNNRIAGYCIQMVMIFLLIGGGAIAGFDQLVTTAITPFIVTCIVSAVVLLIRPIYSLMFYTGSYLLFFFFISTTQTNPDVLISNQVNGITIAALGMCLSFIFWRHNMIRIKQQRTIDIQQKELLKNLNQLIFYSTQLEQSNATKDKLFSVIAHDLRSPFVSVLGITSALSEDFDSLTIPEIKRMLVALDKEINISYEFLNNLLDWSRTQLKRIEPKPEEINLNQLAINTIGIVESLSDSKNITIANKIQEGLVAWADPSMINSVLKNIIVNGIKFTPRGGEINISGKKLDQTIVLCIKDNGIGMTNEQLENLFIQKYDHSTYGTENEKGSGLGLQICKEFTEMNGGKIWVESELGKGTTFYFSLPA
jgi:signal transduction histidine kinase